VALFHVATVDGELVQVQQFSTWPSCWRRLQATVQGVQRGWLWTWAVKMNFASKRYGPATFWGLSGLTLEQKEYGCRGEHPQGCALSAHGLQDHC
jgi:hypothetical protein